jgi:predicted transcriptional regulator
MENVKKDVNKKELSPIERGVRNSVVWRLSIAGFNVSTIANVMNMTQSTVSRVIEKKPESGKLIDTILWGKGSE